MAFEVDNVCQIRYNGDTTKVVNKIKQDTTLVSEMEAKWKTL